MEQENLYKYVIAVRAILDAEGKLSDEEFVKHAIVCCKEAEEINNGLEAQLKEITTLIDTLKDTREKMELLLMKERYPFEVGDKVIVKDCFNGKEEKGIFAGFKKEFYHFVPDIRKIKKNGEMSTFELFVGIKTEIKKI